mgnify:FL=1
MGDLSRRSRGRWAEDLAAAHYRRLGFAVVDRNWRSPERLVRGELDVVVRRGSLVVVVEVKARRSAGTASAALAVDAAKQARIRLLASSWLRCRWDGAFDPQLRFDVVAVDGVRLTRYERAF